MWMGAGFREDGRTRRQTRRQEDKKTTRQGDRRQEVENLQIIILPLASVTLFTYFYRLVRIQPLRYGRWFILEKLVVFVFFFAPKADVMKLVILCVATLLLCSVVNSQVQFGILGGPQATYAYYTIGGK